MDVCLAVVQQLDGFIFLFSVQEFRDCRPVPGICGHFSSKNRGDSDVPQSTKQ